LSVVRPSPKGFWRKIQRWWRVRRTRAELQRALHGPAAELVLRKLCVGQKDDREDVWLHGYDMPTCSEGACSVLYVLYCMFCLHFYSNRYINFETEKFWAYTRLKQVACLKGFAHALSTPIFRGREVLDVSRALPHGPLLVH